MRLHLVRFIASQIKAVCPIDGLAVIDPNDTLTWRIDFDPAATQPQRDAANSLLATWNGLTDPQKLQQLLDGRREQRVTRLDEPEEILRAFMLMIIDQFNEHAAKTNALLDAIDAASNLATLKTAVGAISDLQTYTPAQVRSTVKNKLGL